MEYIVKHITAPATYFSYCNNLSQNIVKMGARVSEKIDAILERHQADDVLTVTVLQYIIHNTDRQGKVYTACTTVMCRFEGETFTKRTSKVSDEDMARYIDMDVPDTMVHHAIAVNEKSNYKSNRLDIECTTHLQYGDDTIDVVRKLSHYRDDTPISLTVTPGAMSCDQSGIHAFMQTLPVRAFDVLTFDYVASMSVLVGHQEIQDDTAHRILVGRNIAIDMVEHLNVDAFSYHYNNGIPEWVIENTIRHCRAYYFSHLRGQFSAFCQRHGMDDTDRDLYMATSVYAQYTKYHTVQDEIELLF